MSKKSHLRVVPTPEPSGLDNLAYVIRLEAHYRLNAREVYVDTPVGPWPLGVAELIFLFRRLCFWRCAPRASFYNFDGTHPW